MPTVHVLRVFAGRDGTGGNPLGVVLDGASLPAREDRQELAAELGFSETVFVDDPARGALAIHTPTVELPFAGHPLVGAAWLLAREGAAPAVLRPPAGEVAARHEPGATFVAGDPSWAPAFDLVELDDPAAVDALDGPPGGQQLVEAWAWADRARGHVRARVFAPGVGIPEDEATGSAAMRLCARIGRPIAIHQGRGSIVRARPVAGGAVEIGGRVELDEVR